LEQPELREAQQKKNGLKAALPSDCIALWISFVRVNPAAATVFPQVG